MSFFGTLFSHNSASSTQNASKPNSTPHAVNPEITFLIRTMEDDLISTGSKNPESLITPSVTPPPPPITNPFLSDSLDNNPITTPQDLSLARQTQHTLPKKEVFPQDPPALQTLSLNQEPPKNIPPVATPPTLPITPAPLPLTPTHTLTKSTPPPSQPQHSSSWILPAGIVALILLLLGGGFWFGRDLFFPPTPSPIVIDDTPITPDPIPTPQPRLPFDEKAPNELSFATNTVSADTIRTTLIEAGQKIQAASMKNPVEFRITDENHNAVSFFIFSKWFGLTPSPELLASLDEPFSLFLYLDGENIRAGLILQSKNIAQTQTLLARDERTLLASFTPLLLQNTFTPPATITFNASTYNGANIRYTNVPVPPAPFEGGLSLDYTLINQSLIFGTSKQTERVLVDIVNTTQTVSAIK